MGMKDLRGHLRGRSNYVRDGTQTKADQRAMDLEEFVKGLVWEVSKQVEMAKDGQGGGRRWKLL